MLGTRALQCMTHTDIPALRNLHLRVVDSLGQVVLLDVSDMQM